MNEHTSDELLEDYVMGEIASTDRQRVEAHVLECERCSARLAGEARLELAMLAVAGGAAQCPGCRRPCPRSVCSACGVARVAGEYAVRAVISERPHARVYLAEAPSGAAVALKELIFAEMPSVEALEAFEREARVLKQLSHPQIPRFIDGFTVGEGASMRFYLVQSFVDGMTLAQHLESHRYTEREVLGLAWQMLGVVRYLQELSPPVVHRDLKPSNVLLKRDGTIAIVDFGTARERGLTHHGTFAGVAGYAPREQLVGQVDATSDPYAIGMILCQLLTRVAPGIRPDLSKANISPATRRWLEQLTAEAPSGRFPSAAIAMQELARLGGAKVPAKVGSVRVAPRRIIFIIGVLMVIGMAITVLAARGRAVPPATGVRVLGYATIFTDPPAAIYFEGRFVGHTPLHNWAIEPGIVTIEARDESGRFRDRAFRIRVRPDVVERYSFELIPR